MNGGVAGGTGGGRHQLGSKRIPRHLTFRVELIRPQMETFCSFDCSAAVPANSELNVCHLSFAHLGDPRYFPDPTLPFPLSENCSLIRQTNVQTSVSLSQVPARSGFVNAPTVFGPDACALCHAPFRLTPPRGRCGGWKNTCLQRAKANTTQR